MIPIRHIRKWQAQCMIPVVWELSTRKPRYINRWRAVALTLKWLRREDAHE